MQAKRILASLLALGILLSGCGSNKEANKTRIGVFFASYERTPQQEALLEGLSQAGYRGVPMDAKGNGELQKTQLSGLLNQGYPLMVIEPVENVQELANMLYQMEVPGIFIGEEPDAAVLESWDKLTYVGTDYTQQGSLQGKIILNCPFGGDINSDETVTYAILRGPSGDSQADFITKHCDVLLREGEHPVNLLAIRECQWSAESAKQEAQKLLAQYGKDLEAILCNSDRLAMGAAQAVEAGGWIVGKDIYVVGTGAERDILPMIDQGKCTGTVSPDMTDVANTIAQKADALLKGLPVEKRSYSNYATVTQENLSVYYDTP